MKMNWRIKPEDHLEMDLKKFKLHLTDRGFRPQTIQTYAECIKHYLKSKLPPNDFRMLLFDRQLARSTINNHGYAIRDYHKMKGETIDWPRLKLDNQLPYYFDAEEVTRIFNTCTNIKHLAMLKTLFYACLRSSELSNLDDEDLDLNKLMIRVRCGKGGQDGIVLISEDCAATLKTYLSIRPTLEIDNRKPLFYTDYKNRWSRQHISRVFHVYKAKAKITRRGGVHCFSRHSPATILIKNGCSINIVQEILRHKDIRSTLRYSHISNSTKREKYNQFLTLAL